LKFLLVILNILSTKYWYRDVVLD